MWALGCAGTSGQADNLRTTTRFPPDQQKWRLKNHYNASIMASALIDCSAEFLKGSKFELYMPNGSTVFRIFCDSVNSVPLELFLSLSEPYLTAYITYILVR